MPCSPRCTCCAKARLALKALTSLRSILLYLISSSTRGLSVARTANPPKIENPDGWQRGCGATGLAAAQIKTLDAPSGDAAGMYVVGQVTAEKKTSSQACLLFLEVTHLWPTSSVCFVLHALDTVIFSVEACPTRDLPPHRDHIEHSCTHEDPATFGVRNNPSSASGPVPSMPQQPGGVLATAWHRWVYEQT